MTTSRFPLDYDALKKGDFLTAQMLEVAIVHPIGSDKWRMALLVLREEIERRCKLISKIEHEGLRILTDAEADDYTIASIERRTHGLQRDAARRALIDRSGMTTEQQRIAEARDATATLTAVAAAKELRRGMRVIQGEKDKPQIVGNAAQK